MNTSSAVTRLGLALALLAHSALPSGAQVITQTQSCSAVCAPVNVCTVRACPVDTSVFTDWPRCYIDTGIEGRIPTPPCHGFGNAMRALGATAMGMIYAIHGGCHTNNCGTSFGATPAGYAAGGSAWY